jgi:hypothetical protein
LSIRRNKGSLHVEDAVFGSVILEVFLGLVLFYAWFSLACSALTEFLETIRAQRGKQLSIAISGMLGEELATHFYRHGLIRSFSKGQRLPSYVTPRSFALVTLSLLGIDSTNHRELVMLVRGGLGETLRTLHRTSENYDVFVLSIERWFEATMDRCSGWFRRRARWASFLTSLVMAVALNVDSIEIASALYSDNLLRLSLVAQAERVSLPVDGKPSSDLQQMTTISREKIGLPIGWENARIVARRASLPSGFAFFVGPLLSKMFGLLATALAGSLGASFWFDALNRTIALRSRLSQKGLSQRVEELVPQGRVAVTEGSRGSVPTPTGSANLQATTGLVTQPVAIAANPIVGVGPSV